MKDAKEAFSNEDYAKVVESLEKEESLNDECTEILHISRAHIAMDNKEPLVALKEIIQIENATDQEVYVEARDSIVASAIKNRKTKMLLEAIEVDPEMIPYAADEAIAACDNLDYGGFVVLQKLKKTIDDGEVKDKLEEYYGLHKLDKPKSFLIGRWVRIRDDRNNAIVDIKPAGDNLIGTLIRVGDSMKEYHFLKGDLYWSDFTFVNVDEYTCKGISRSIDGSIHYVNDLVEIDYKNGIIHAHGTPTSSDNLISIDIYWQKE